jgi:hypothetical protein
VLPSPRSASAAKRARHSQRGSLASAGGTELLQVRRTAGPASERPYLTRAAPHRRRT